MGLVNLKKRHSTDLCQLLRVRKNTRVVIYEIGPLRACGQSRAVFPASKPTRQAARRRVEGKKRSVGPDHVACCRVVDQRALVNFNWPM